MGRGADQGVAGLAAVLAVQDGEGRRVAAPLLALPDIRPVHALLDDDAALLRLHLGRELEVLLLLLHAALEDVLRAASHRHRAEGGVRALAVRTALLRKAPWQEVALRWQVLPVQLLLPRRLRRRGIRRAPRAARGARLLRLRLPALLCLPRSSARSRALALLALRLGRAHRLLHGDRLVHAAAGAVAHREQLEPLQVADVCGEQLLVLVQLHSPISKPAQLIVEND